MKVIYQGLSEAQRKRALDGMVSKLDPTGAKDGYLYKIEKEDHPITVQQKMASIKKWKDERISEHTAHLDDLDAHRMVEGIDFPKGKTVDVPDEHPANRTEMPSGDTVDGPIHGYIKSKMFKVVDDDGAEVQQKPAPAKAEQKQGKR
jgi:hypothetical protein